MRLSSRLLDRWPRGREGLILALATAVIAALLGAAAAVYTWGDGSPENAAAEPSSSPGHPGVPLVSRAGGFSIVADADLVGDKLPRGVKLTTQAGDLVITVGTTGSDGLRAGHAAALQAIRATFPELRIERTISTRLGDLRARRSVGLVRRARGDALIVSVTTGAAGRRTWSVVLFAARDVDPERLERFYQPVLDSFRPLR